MEHSNNDASAPLAMASVFISLALHAGAMTWFAFVDPRAGQGAGIFAVESPSSLLVIPPLDLAAALPPPAEPPVPPPQPLPEPPPPEMAPPPPVEEETVRPGIDESQADTPNWLGFSEATPHSGARSTIEQSALSPNPGLPLPIGIRAPEGMPVPPATTPSSAANPAQAQPAIPQPAAAQPVEQTPPAQPTPLTKPEPAPQPTQPAPIAPAAAMPVAPTGERIDAPVRDAVPSVTKATPKPDAALKEPEATGDGIKRAPKVDATEGEDRPSPAPKLAPADSKGQEAAPPAPKDSPLKVIEKGDQPHETEGIRDGKREATDDATREGAAKSDDPRASEPVKVQEPLKERMPQEPAPEPMAPKAGEGPAPTPAASPAPVSQPDATAQTPEESAPAPAQDSAPTPASQPAPVSPSMPDATQAEPREMVGPVMPPDPLPVPAPAGIPSRQGVESSGTAPGEASDAESTAAALEEAVDVRPGKVLAAKGLKIQTVRPEWSVTTRIMSSPRNPVVRVTFGRSGKVIKADFVEGQTTGWPEVDGPLKDALYRWTASGEELKKLPPAPPPRADGKPVPQRGISLTFRVLLRTDTPFEP